MNEEKYNFIVKFDKHIQANKIEDNSQISMKEINELFLDMGYELSKMQLNEVFMEMDAGRKFNLKRFQKWVRGNYNCLMKKIPRTKKDLLSLN